MIEARIVMGERYSTTVTGKTIEQIVEKIKEFHTMNEFEESHYTKRGTLTKEKKSGWYFKTKG